MKESDLWLLCGRLASLLVEATTEQRGGAFDLRVKQALDDFDEVWPERHERRTAGVVSQGDTDG